MKRNCNLILQARGCVLEEWEFDTLRTQDEQYDEYLDKREVFESVMGGNIDKYRSKMSSFYKYSNEKGGIYVYFENGETDSKPKKDDIKALIASVAIVANSNKGEITVFYISPGKLNKVELEMLDSSSNDKLKYHIFLHEMMLIDRSFHVMNPVSLVLSQQEKDQYYKRTNTNAAMFDRYMKPKYTQDDWVDPIILYRNLKSGDLVRNLQKNDYTPQIITKSISYRVVS